MLHAQVLSLFETSWVTVDGSWILSLGLIFSLRKEVSDLDLAIENRGAPYMLGRNSTGLMVTNQAL